MIELRTDSLGVKVDPGYGADILSIRTLPDERELLWSSPWRSRAEAIIGGAPSAAADSVTANLERYRGGWQTLCPNAGAARTVHGGPVGFHGEVARSAWNVEASSEHTAALSLDLISVPVRLHRQLRLAGSALTLTDSLVNLSDQDLEFDYCHHPAFGGDLLKGECEITTGARRFVSDPETGGLLPPGQVTTWPLATTPSEVLDLSRLPAPGHRQMIFGWLEDFDEHWYAITNPDQGLSVRVDWDGGQMPYAWFWQELNDSTGYPWYRRARVQAIEPASTQTSGPSRRSVMRLGARAEITLNLSVTVNASHPSGVDPALFVPADRSHEGA